MKFQKSISGRAKNNGRERIIYTRQQSVSPVSRKRPRYSESRSRSPEGYRYSSPENQYKDRTFERYDNSRHRSPMKRREIRQMFDRFDISSSDRRYSGTMGGDSERYERFDISPRRSYLRTRNDDRGRRDKFVISPSRSHRDERDPFCRYSNSPDHSDARWRDDTWNVETFGNTPDRSSTSNEESERSDLSYEQLSHNLYNRRSYSPHRSEDIISDIDCEYGDLNEYETRHDGNRASTRRNVRRFPVICKFYNNEGKCKRGDSCAFLHVCKYFIHDNCKFGKGCLRSHNVLDKQPRYILSMYDMIPEGYIPGNFANSREITDLIKDKLKNIESKLLSGKGKSNIDRPMCSNVTTYKWTSSLKESSHLDKISDDEADPDENQEEREGTGDTVDSSVIRSDNSEGELSDHPSQRLMDFIPLETDVKAEIKDKTVDKRKRKKISKIDKRKRKKISKRSERSRNIETPTEQKNDKETVNQDQPEDSKAVLTVQSTVTFESQIPCRAFRVRKTNDGWQISNKCDEWVNLDETDSDVFREMYKRAFEIGQKVLRELPEIRPEQKLFDE